VNTWLRISPDDVVNVLERSGDVRPVRLMGRVQGGLLTQASMVEIVDDPVEQVLAEVR
jgi:hypothetical protein